MSRWLAILTQSSQIQMKLAVEELVVFGRFLYSGGRLTDEDKRIIDQRFPTWNWRPSGIDL